MRRKNPGSISRFSRSRMWLAQKKHWKSQRAVSSILTLLGTGGVGERYASVSSVMRSMRSVIRFMSRRLMARDSRRASPPALDLRQTLLRQRLPARAARAAAAAPVDSAAAKLGERPRLELVDHPPAQLDEAALCERAEQPRERLARHAEQRRERAFRYGEREHGVRRAGGAELAQEISRETLQRRARRGI